MSQIGPVNVEITGRGEIADLVRREIDPHISADASPDVVFEIVSSRDGGDPAPSHSTEVKGSRVLFRFSARSSDESLELRLGMKGPGRDLYRVEILDDLLGGDPVRIRIMTRGFSRSKVLINPFVRWLGRDRAGVSEILAKNIIYEIIDPITWIRLLFKDATFVHASAVAHEGRSVLFSGSGGVGKSTSLLSLMDARRDFSYIGDDLVVVDRKGRIWRHPKKLQIYEYNLRGSSQARSSVFRMLGPHETRLWRLRSAVLGPSRVRTRIAAGNLFGEERVAEDGELISAAWLTPARDEPGWTSMALNSFTAKATAAIIDEFWDFLRLINLGSEIDTRAPSLVELAQRSSEILHDALYGISCYAIDFPIGGESTRFLESFVDHSRGSTGVS